jgi:hypothetical protein
MLDAARRSEVRLRLEIPNQEHQAIEEMRRRGLKVSGGADLAEWQREADRLTQSMRGKVVPADILDEALTHRDSYRRRNARLTTVADDH